MELGNLKSLEPFVPSFSAKLYFLMNLERTKNDEILLSELSKEFGKEKLLNLLKPEHEIR